MVLCNIRITTRQVYLLRTAVAGIPRYDWMDYQQVRYQNAMRRMPDAAGSKGKTEAKDENHAGTDRATEKIER